MTAAAAPSAILFDLDGTLVDTYRLYLECYRRALAPHLGYAPTDAEIIGLLALFCVSLFPRTSRMLQPTARPPGPQRLRTGWPPLRPPQA